MKYVLVILCSVFFEVQLIAQQNNSDSLQVKTDSVSEGWSFAASAYYYVLPDEDDQVTLLGYADFKSWHIEARYNYEDVKTGSVFGGYRFETGNKLVFGATPMVGAVFGNTNGIAPGLELDLTWKKFDFYSETEYVFDLEGKQNDFLYTWSELAITPIENLRTGFSANRTRLFQSDLDFGRGVFAEYSFWKLTAGVHYFNPFSSDYFVLATLGIEF